MTSIHHSLGRGPVYSHPDGDRTWRGTGQLPALLGQRGEGGVEGRGAEQGSSPSLFPQLSGGSLRCENQSRTALGVQTPPAGTPGGAMAGLGRPWFGDAGGLPGEDRTHPDLARGLVLDHACPCPPRHDLGLVSHLTGRYFLSVR